MKKSRCLILKAAFCHNLLHSFLNLPPRLSQVYSPHKDAMPAILIPIRKVEILIHGGVNQGAASIQSMRLAPVFLVHHIRKNLREMLPSYLLPAAILRNQRFPIKLGVQNKLLLRLRVEKRHVSLHHWQRIARLLKHHSERRKLEINVFPMHLRIFLPAMLLAEIHQKALKDAVHPELILREIHKLQSSVFILDRKRRIPNQLADIQRQQINPMMAMPRKMPRKMPRMIP